MSTAPAVRPAPGAPAAQNVHAALSSTARPARPGPLSTAITFGWRGMLKIKHVPEQLMDVTITPVLFVLMFTYLFGGALAGLGRAGVSLADFSLGQPSLDEVFLALTGHATDPAAGADRPLEEQAS